MLNEITNSLNFQSGLSSNVIVLQHKVNCRQIEKMLDANQNIKANFADNKPLTLAVFIANNILEYLNKTFNFPKLLTPSINVYKSDELLLDKNLYHFCIPDERMVLINKQKFKAGSIFYKDISSLEELDFQREKAYKLGLKSSNHFLADILHEMMHSAYLKQLFDKCKKQSINIPQLLLMLQNKTFGVHENKIIEDVLGKESTAPINQYHEVFAETFANIICASISNKTFLPIKNPLDELKRYPKEFLKILQNVINIAI